MTIHSNRCIIYTSIAMNLALTNYGLRFAAESVKNQRGSAFVADPCTSLLDRLQTEILVPYRNSPEEMNLISRGLAEAISQVIGREQIALRYKRNPLEHIHQVAFEYTSRCNLHCRHCYNANVERVTETDLAVLKSAVDIFVPMGIKHFIFVGGEVSKFGDGWLEVVQHMHSKINAIVTLFTNGWWLGQQDFWAAGRTYRSDTEYLTELRRCGLTHILFSIDGLGEVHDRNRGVPGLFDRILKGFIAVRDAGLEPRVSVVIRSGMDDLEYFELLNLLAEGIYSFPPGAEKEDRIEKISFDPLNVFTNLIDIGNQASAIRNRSYYLPEVPDELLYCKGFFRPSPFLTIKANGEFATCRLADAGEGYGNIHKQDLIEIINHCSSSKDLDACNNFLSDTFSFTILA